MVSEPFFNKAVEGWTENLKSHFFKALLFHVMKMSHSYALMHFT